MALFHPDGLDLEGVEGKLDLALLVRRDLLLVVFQDVRQGDALRRGAEG